MFIKIKFCFENLQEIHLKGTTDIVGKMGLKWLRKDSVKM
jgi:hypothetical protein